MKSGLKFFVVFLEPYFGVFPKRSFFLVRQFSARFYEEKKRKTFSKRRDYTRMSNMICHIFQVIFLSFVVSRLSFDILYFRHLI